MKPRTVKHRLNPAQRLVVVVMDILILTELAFCMYWSGRTPEAMTSEFLRLYLPLLLVTVIGARLVMHRLRSPEPATGAQTP